MVVGLYATMLPLLGYALFGSSRQLVVGPEGALAALTAVTIAPLAGGDPAQYAALAAALALVMGVVMVLGGLLHLGFMADFFSKPVLLGYINGTALTIIASQLGKLLGLSISGQDFFPMLREVLSELHQVDSLTLLISISLLWPRLPPPPGRAEGAGDARRRGRGDRDRGLRPGGGGSRGRR